MSDFEIIYIAPLYILGIVWLFPILVFLLFGGIQSFLEIKFKDAPEGDNREKSLEFENGARHES